MISELYMHVRMCGLHEHVRVCAHTHTQRWKEERKKKKRKGEKILVGATDRLRRKLKSLTTTLQGCPTSVWILSCLGREEELQQPRRLQGGR